MRNSRLERLNSPVKIIDRMINYPVKQRFLRRFPRPSIAFAKDYFKGRLITVAEIGTFRGENANSILTNLKVKDFYVIDPYEPYLSYKNDGYYSLVEKAERIARRRLNKFRKKVKFIKKYSGDAPSLIPDCDFIYIDGNHNYEYVLDDLKKYSKKVSPGGIIAGHDTQIKGVVNALLEFTKTNKKYQLHIESPDWWMTEKK